MVQLASILAAVALTSAAAIANVEAHPGQQPHHRSLAEQANTRNFKHQAQRSLKACENSDAHRQLKQRAIARRQAKARELREAKQANQANQRRLRQQASADVLATSHKSNLTGITGFSSANADVATLFGASPKCILEPEVTQGPYYVKGELIRDDIRESQAGVDLYAELQIIDVNTCEPVTDLYLDFWHCNSTGVYAGVVASGNGNTNDLANINATFLRGLSPTDEDGIVQFTTKFPGHYTSRATHIHVLGNHGGEVLANNTYSGSTVASVGQLFFDQDLITAVEATGKYATNTQQITLNSADSIFAEETASGFDPVMEYVYVGDSVEDGVFAWISIGIDATITNTVNPAATLTENGGVASTSTVGGGGGGMGGGSGMGAPPSGSGMGGGPGGFGSVGGSFAGPGSLPAAGSVAGDADASSSTVGSSTSTTPTTTTVKPSSNCAA